jgi:hypothetical protein
MHIDTQSDGDFMKYAIEMGSGAMKYITSFIQTGSAIEKLT